MGSDRPAYRYAHDGSQRGGSAIFAAATSAGRKGFRNRINLCAVAASGPVLSENVFPVREHRRNASRGARMSFELGRHFGLGQSTEWKRLREPAKRVALKR